MKNRPFTSENVCVPKNEWHVFPWIGRDLWRAYAGLQPVSCCIIGCAKQAITSCYLSYQICSKLFLRLWTPYTNAADTKITVEMHIIFQVIHEFESLQ